MPVLSGRNQTTPREREKRAQDNEANAAEAIPPELLVRRDNTVRYERNGPIYATDGKVGTLVKVVVDEATAMVSELVISVDGANGKRVVMTADIVDRSAGAALFITLNRTQFNERVATQPEYRKNEFAKSDLKALLSRIGATGNRSPRRSITNAGQDFVETPSGSPLDRLQSPRTSYTSAAAD